MNGSQPSSSRRRWALAMMANDAAAPSDPASPTGSVPPGPDASPPSPSRTTPTVASAVAPIHVVRRRPPGDEPLEQARHDRRRAECDDRADRDAVALGPEEEERLVDREAHAGEHHEGRGDGCRPSPGSGSAAREAAASPLRSALTRCRCASVNAMSASPVPPIARRTAPIARGVAPSGPSACDVPVVPNRTAAAKTARTWSIPSSYFIASRRPDQPVRGDRGRRPALPRNRVRTGARR